MNLIRDKPRLGLLSPHRIVDFNVEDGVTPDKGCRTLALCGRGEYQRDPEAHRAAFSMDDTRTAIDEMPLKSKLVGKVRSLEPGFYVNDGTDLDSNRFSIKACKEEASGYGK